MSESEFIAWVKLKYNINDKNPNFDVPFNDLNDTISFKNSFTSINQYIDDKDNNNVNKETIENAVNNNGYLLAHLFNVSGLPLNEKNKNIIKDILRKNKKLGNGNELNEFIKFALIDGSKNFENFNRLDKNKVTTLQLDKFSNLAKYIYSIKDFSKAGSTTNSGPGELLLQLLFGYKTNENENKHKGDVIIGDKSLEVKSTKARLKAAKNLLKSPNEMYEYLGTQLNEKFELNKDENHKNQINEILNNNKIGGYRVINKLFNSLTKKLDDLGYSNPGEIVFNCLKDMYKYQFIKIKNVDEFNYEISYSPNNENVGQSLLKYHTAYALYAYQIIDGFNYFMIFNDKLQYLLIDIKEKTQ